MKVKALGKEWIVKNPEYEQKRELHYLSMKLFPGGRSENMDVEIYKQLLEMVGDISGAKEELDKLNVMEQDEVLNSIFMAYQGLDEKKLGG